MKDMWRAICCLFSVLFFFAPVTLRAHEIRPGYLEITEDSRHNVHVLWKQPIMGEVAIRLVPHLSSGWLDKGEFAFSNTDAYLIREWNNPESGVALMGQTVTIEGLDRTMTDVLLRVTFADRGSLTKMLSPLEPSFAIEREAKETVDRLGYFRLGIEHILYGLDHLLFVFGLLLIVRRTSVLLKTITAFTVAHTITLGLATFGVLRIPALPVEAVISLSIIFLASEVVKQQRGIETLTSHAPWLVAFSFGLLHGFGFAGTLTRIGIPHADVPVALLLFNCGVEVGQLSFVVVYFLFIQSLQTLEIAWPALLKRVPPYAIGSIASFWFLQRCVLMVT
jgi:hydrogenase/urease accessory protein HupE